MSDAIYIAGMLTLVLGPPVAIAAIVVVGLIKLSRLPVTGRRI